MAAYTLIETDEPVKGIKPAIVTRFKWRAIREWKRQIAYIGAVDSYRWVVYYEPYIKRWVVMAMQNKLVPYNG